MASASTSNSLPQPEPYDSLVHPPIEHLGKEDQPASNIKNDAPQSVESGDEKQAYQSSDRDLPPTGLTDLEEYNNGPTNPYLERFHSFRVSLMSLLNRMGK